jgi:hypothetical protein
MKLRIARKILKSMHRGPFQASPHPRHRMDVFLRALDRAGLAPTLALILDRRVSLAMNRQIGHWLKGRP